MGLTIKLLGPPNVQRDGVPHIEPRGHKPWALLTYVLRSDAAPSRERLADLLFRDADDPFGALRWNLSQLRRVLGNDVTIEGDPLRLELPKEALVDLDVLSKGTWVEAVGLPGLGHSLIEGVDLDASPAFELWLANERRHVAGLAEAVLREATLASLARGDAVAAADYAARLVGLAPFDESSHVLLVRSLGAAGRAEAAARQVATCTELFRRELGVDPSPALRTAAAAPERRYASHLEDRSAIVAKLEAGESAVAAGALDVGLEALRGATAAARVATDRHLLARTLVALGSALVYGAIGGNEEGTAVLQEASAVAEELDDAVVSATVMREIARLDLLRGRYERAEASLVRAAQFASGDDLELTWIRSMQGGCRVDIGDYAGARAFIDSAIQHADLAADGRARAYARTELGRWHLLRLELQEAREVLDAALREAQAERWTYFISLPESLRAEVDLIAGDTAAARDGFEHAFALGCQLGDACWEAIAARGLGLVAAARGDVTLALQLLADATRRSRRVPDSYLWIEAYSMESLCAIGVEHGARLAGRWIDDLQAMASKSGMRELVVRAALHRTRLGGTSLAEAVVLASGVDNPALEKLLSRPQA